MLFYDKKGKDTFVHEQNLIISENKAVVIMGGHGCCKIWKKQRGINHIFVLVVFVQPTYKENSIKGIIKRYCRNYKSGKDIEFYTCHCTGERHIIIYLNKWII